MNRNQLRLARIQSKLTVDEQVRVWIEHFQSGIPPSRSFWQVPQADAVGRRVHSVFHAHILLGLLIDTVNCLLGEAERTLTHLTNMRLWALDVEAANEALAAIPPESQTWLVREVLPGRPAAVRASETSGVEFLTGLFAAIYEQLRTVELAVDSMNEDYGVEDVLESLNRSALIRARRRLEEFEDGLRMCGGKPKRLEPTQSEVDDVLFWIERD
jgi:hypothetical protein